MKTGWGEGPDEAPAMPLTSMVLGMRQRGPGDVLETALARARGAEARERREEAASAPDPDERAANLVVRGYAPGMLTDLGQRLADVEARLADEEAKLERSARRAERTRQMHERGQIDAFGIAARWQAEVDEGDPAAVERLTRRRDSLQRQLAEAMQLMAPQRAPEDPLEAASRRAHRVLAEVTRSQARERPAPQERPPFGSVSRFAGRSTEHTGDDCWVCREGRRRDAARASGEVNVYQVPPGGWEAVRAEDEADGVIRRGTEGAVLGLR